MLAWPCQRHFRISAEADDAHDRIQRLKGGASAYLASPVAPEELLATVGMALSAGREAQAARDERRFAFELQQAFLLGCWTITLARLLN
ncbi:hypothetical protein [Streptomyces sp. NPDC051994]|uniref:hypothetical protein n=1 Tax=unclassified Streptomyces TaxID=2593676 RepID=UPI00342F4826